MSATDDEDLLKHQLELLSNIDGAVNEFIWNGDNWRSTVYLKFNFHKNYMVSCLWHSLAKMMEFVEYAVWFVAYGVLHAVYFAFGFTCVMWVAFIIHLCFNRLLRWPIARGK